MRRGITLLEVLFAIFILAIGLLSVLSLLPIGKSQIRDAVHADRSRAGCRNALADFKTRGYMSTVQNEPWVDQPVDRDRRILPHRHRGGDRRRTRDGRRPVHDGALLTSARGRTRSAGSRRLSVKGGEPAERVSRSPVCPERVTGRSAHPRRW